MTRDRGRASGPVIAGIVSGLAALLSSSILRQPGIAPGWRLFVALLPAPFFVWFLLTELRWVRGLDEFHQRVVLDSLAIAFPATITIGVVIDGLQQGGFITTWGVGDVWPFMALIWLPSLWIANRRYPRNDAGE